MARRTRRSPRRIQAVLDMVEAIKSALKKHSPYIRKKAWGDLSSKKGTKEMNKIFRNLNRSTSPFRTLWSENFKQWMDDQKE